MRKLARSMLFATCAAVFAMPVTTAAAATITVKQGDTLWSIAAHYHISLSNLLRLNPTVQGDTIQVGMKLVVPGTTVRRSAPTRQRITFTVRAGDSLWSIAVAHHITIHQLQVTNPQLHGTYDIQPGQTVWVPGSGASAAHVQASSVQRVAQTSQSAATGGSAASLSGRDESFGPAGASAAADDLYWMAHIIHAEANGQSLDAKIAVGDVVWHRMLATPGSTVKDIVFQQSNGNYQFSTVPEGYVYGTPDSDSQVAAVDVLEKHIDEVPGAYVFYGAHQQNDSWVLQQPVVTTIGDFVFAK